MRIYTLETREKRFDDPELADVRLADIEPQIIQYFATKDLAVKYLDDYLAVYGYGATISKPEGRNYAVMEWKNGDAKVISVGYIEPITE